LSFNSGTEAAGLVTPSSVVKKGTAVPLLPSKKNNVSSSKSFVKEPFVKRDLPRAYYDGIPFWQYVVSCFSPNRA
jgi:hypothetical protein